MNRAILLSAALSSALGATIVVAAGPSDSNAWNVESSSAGAFLVGVGATRTPVPSKVDRSTSQVAELPVGLHPASEPATDIPRRTPTKPGDVQRGPTATPTPNPTTATPEEPTSTAKLPPVSAAVPSVLPTTHGSAELTKPATNISRTVPPEKSVGRPAVTKTPPPSNVADAGLKDSGSKVRN